MPVLQTVAVLTALGPRRFFAMLEVEDEQVSLAAYSLLQVMFDSLKEGLQREVRGKEEAVVPGEYSLAPLMRGASLLVAKNGRLQSGGHGRGGRPQCLNTKPSEGPSAGLSQCSQTLVPHPPPVVRRGRGKQLLVTWRSLKVQNKKQFISLPPRGPSGMVWCSC